MSETLTDFMQKHTLVLFHSEHPGWVGDRPEPVGSGVLLTTSGKYYIVTAAHVVADYVKQKRRGSYSNDVEDMYDKPEDGYLSLNNIGYMVESSFHTLGSLLYCKEDWIDIAVLRLTEEQADNLTQVRSFVLEDDCALGHQVALSFVYHVYGFPGEWIECDDVNKTVYIPGFEYSGFAFSKHLDYCHIYVNYDPKYLSKKYQVDIETFHLVPS